MRPLIRTLVLVGLVGLCAPLGARALTASAPPPSSEEWKAGAAWVPQPVRTPVRPDDVRAVEPFVPAAIPETPGRAQLGPDAGAAFWMEPLTIVRVRGPKSGKTPHFFRVVGAGARMEEVAEEDGPGAWVVREGPGLGSSWLVLGAERMEVQVERAVNRAGVLVWEELRARTLAWIDGTAELPPVTEAPGWFLVRSKLVEQAAIGELLRSAGSEGLAKAVPVWRKAAALRAFDEARPFDTSGSALDPLTSRLGGLELLPGSDRPYARVTAPQVRWTLELEGPATLLVEARTLLTTPEARPLGLQIAVDGRLLKDTRAVLGAGRELDEVLQPSAFPAQAPALQTSRGEPVSWERAQQIALLPGRHRYEVSAEGGPLLVRALRAVRRPWLRERLAHEDERDVLQKRVDALLSGDASPQANLLRALVAEELGTAVSTELGSQPTAGLRTLAALVRARASASSDAVLKALDLSLDPQTPAPLRRMVRLDAARLLVRLGAAEEGARALRGSAAETDGAWLLDAAEVLLRVPGHRRGAIAALDAAWRRQPLVLEIRRRYLQAWFSEGAWNSVLPRDAITAAGSHQRVRFLEVARTAGAPDELTPQACNQLVPRTWALGSGTNRLRAEPSPIEPARPAVLRLFAMTSKENPGPVHVRVGSTRFDVVGLQRVEELELALPPGEHEVEASGPAGISLFSSLPVLGESGRVSHAGAFTRTAWPVRLSQAPTRFDLPAGGAPVIRFQLRALGTLEGAAPEVVWLRTDRGESKRIVIDAIGHDGGALSLGSRELPLSGAIEGVAVLPPGTRQVWFEPERVAERWIATVAVREGCEALPTLPPRAQNATTKLDESLTAQVRELSLALAEKPDDVELLERRASLLLELDAAGLAYRDYQRLLASTDDASQAAARRLSLLHASYRDPAYLRVPPDPSVFAQATLLTPTLDSHDPAERIFLAEIARVARTEGPDAAIAKLESAPHRSFATRLLHARLLRSAGKPSEAAELLLTLAAESGQWQVGAEATPLYEDLLLASDVAPASVPLAYGLASWLRESVDLPVARRVLGLAASRSGWMHLDQVLDSAGVEAHLPVADAAMDATSWLLRQAVLPTPWEPEKAQVIDSGRAAVIALELANPTDLPLELFCTSQPEWPETMKGPCRVDVRVDGRALRREEIPLDRRHALTLPMPAGKHQLEVNLGGEHRTLSVYAAQGRPLEPPATSFIARSDRPVSFTVLGPATLQIEVRDLGSGLSAPLKIESFQDSGDPATAEVQLPTAGGGKRVRQTVLLPTAGPQRVVIRPEQGTTALRLALRTARDTNAGLPDRDWSVQTAALAIPGSDGMGDLPRGLPSVHAPQQLGTFSAGTGVTREDVAEDDATRPLHTGLETTLGFRRELLPARRWLRVETIYRQPFEDGAAVFGGRLAFDARKLPYDLRLRTEAEGFTQQLANTRGWGVRGWAMVDRPFPLTPTLLFYPVVGGAFDVFSQGPGGVQSSDFDRAVFRDYGLEHTPRLLADGVLRWWPLQDHLAVLRAGVVTNSDLASIDRTDLSLAWRFLLDVPALRLVRGSVRYELSLRWADADRSEDLQRHSLALGLDWPAWVGPAGRLLVTAHDSVYATPGVELRQVFVLGLRFDWMGGRGMRDIALTDEDFEDVVGRRFWDRTW